MSVFRWIPQATALAMVGVVLAACDTSSTPLAQPTAHPSRLPAPRSSGLIVAHGHGWTAAGLDGTIPAAGACHMTFVAGDPLPDPACTPGVVDAAVTDANVAATVCRKGGYTAGVRPPQALTDAAKSKIMAAYGIPARLASKYELDHLVPLDAGGASDVRNLWPEPNADRGQYKRSAFVHNDKDAIESWVLRAGASAGICVRTVAVMQVQDAIASSWPTALTRLGLPPIPAGFAGAAGVAQ